MEVVGLVHSIGGRPVPGDILVARDAAIDCVIQHISKSPYATRVSVGREEAGKLLDDDYYNMEPWPFSSLTT